MRVLKTIFIRRHTCNTITCKQLKRLKDRVDEDYRTMSGSSHYSGNIIKQENCTLFQVFQNESIKLANTNVTDLGELKNLTILDYNKAAR